MLPATTGALLLVTACPDATCCLICLNRLPVVGRIGLSCQVTLSCAAAWIASYSSGATTPRKFPCCKTFTFGICAIEFGSIETIVAPLPIGP